MAAAAIPAIGGLVSSLLGGIFGNRPQTIRTSNTASGTSAGTSALTPTYDAPNLAGYQAQGVSNINQAGNLRTRMIQNSLAARGLSYSPVAALAPAASE